MKKIKFSQISKIVILSIILGILCSGAEISKDQIILKDPEFPKDPAFYKQIGLRNINIIEAWKLSVGRGKGIKIAVIDSGFKPGSDFDRSRFIVGYDYRDKSASEEPKKITIADNFDDDCIHGNHITHMIFEATDNGIGAAGSAPDAELMVFQVLDDECENYSPSQIAHAIKLAVKKGADIINLSLEIPFHSDEIKATLDKVSENNVMIIAASGNSGKDSISYLSNDDEVLMVGALDQNNEISTYSNRAELYAPGGSSNESTCVQVPNLKKFAPGTGIIQLIPVLTDEGIQDVYIACSGTSQSTAYVTSVTALVMSILKPKGIQSPEMVKKIILESARQDSVRKLDAGRAVKLAYQLVNPQVILLEDQNLEPNKFSSIILEIGKKLYENNKFIESIRLLMDLEKLELQHQPDPYDHWNKICWYGSLFNGINGKREQINKIIFSCEKAVKLQESRKQSPNELYQHYYYSTLENRGIARALRGDEEDIHEAINDFEEVIANYPFKTFKIDEYCDNVTSKQQRKNWVAALKRGEDPFTIKTLTKLREKKCWEQVKVAEQMNYVPSEQA
ncbi:MAG: S8 family serine peptidase [Moorea sp. SIO2I5]|nr:S8 family serine peptidase [Moorena sp. SIO2I5]